MLQQRARALRGASHLSNPRLSCSVSGHLMQCLRRPLTCTITSTIPEHLLHLDLPGSAIMSSADCCKPERSPE